MLLRSYALLLLICPLASSQTQAVTGTVVSTVDSVPIANANVMLFGGGANQTVLTDQSGAFSFGSVPPGSYNLSAQHHAYFFPAGGVQVVAAQKPLEPIRLRMTPYVKLTGKVTDENGYPFPNVVITAIQRVLYQGKASLAMTGSAGTGDSGEFAMPQLRGGTYLVCVNANASPYQRHHRLAYQTTCFPNTTDLSSAAWLTLGLDAEQSLSFHLSPVTGIRLRGSIENASKGVSLSIVRTDPPGFPFVQSFPVSFDEKTATFEVLSLPPGDYSLTAFANGATGQKRATRTIHAGTEDLNDVRLVLEEPMPLSGTVHMGTALPNAVGVSLGGDQTVIVYANASGTFSLPTLSPGDHAVQVISPPGWIVQSILQGGLAVRDEKISIPETGSPEPIEITLRQGGGILQVVVPKGSAAITLLKRSTNGRDWLQQGQTVGVNNARSTQLSNLPPGEYSLFVWESPNEIEYLNPDVLTKYQSLGQTVTIREGETTRVSAQIIPGH